MQLVRDMLLRMPRPDNDQTNARTLTLIGKKSIAVSLPIDIVRQLSWQKGDRVIVRRQGNTIVIHKPEE